MKIKTAIIALFILLPSICLAEIKYNPMTGQWESAPRDSSLKYNPWDREWSYERRDSSLEYNPWTGKWKYER
tara:strand:- start:16 stop:231 length:216 start_codon:yes stop_codon:yes gene_type:complete